METAEETEPTNDVSLEVALEQLAHLLKKGHDASAYEVGDRVAEILPLITETDRKLEWLTNRLQYSASRLSECKCVALLFRPAQRKGHNFQMSLLAYRIFRRMGRALQMSAIEIRDEIENLNGGKRYNEVRRHFKAKQISRLSNMPISNIRQGDSTGFAGRCHHGNCLDILREISDGSARLVIADPPYGCYSTSRGDGVLATECDNNEPEEALAVTLSIFARSRAILSDDGLLLLFQPGMRCDNPEILRTAKRCGFVCTAALTWLKGSDSEKLSSRPSSEAFVPVTERVLVFSHNPDGEIKRLSGRPTQPELLNFPSVTVPAIHRMDAGYIDYGSIHMFEKPVALFSRLIETLTSPGNLVIEPFGCTGPASVAAIESGRRYIYIESNAANFRRGEERIHRAELARAERIQTVSHNPDRAPSE
jgi:DNA modification methylase